MDIQQTCMLNEYENELSSLYEFSDATADIVIPDSAKLRTDLLADSGFRASFGSLASYFQSIANAQTMSTGS